MKKILIFGAGRSAFFTIEYLAGKHGKEWELTVADSAPASLDELRKQFPEIKLVVVDVLNDEQRKALVSENDIIISLLPARFHNIVAADCITFRKHIITPSYITPEIKLMDESAKHHGLIFLNELGLDPGIDHMSAMKIIHHLKNEGNEISSFKSYTGGLIAAESDTNPWHYKISWNPYNIIRAGQDGGICLADGNKKYLPYNRLFAESENISTESSGNFDAYLNRNSLSYMELYELKNVQTFIRGTLRYPGFGRMWQFLVNTGISNDKIIIEDTDNLNWKDFFRIFMPEPDKDISYNFKKVMGFEASPDEIKAIEWLDFFSNEKIKIHSGTAAQVLQELLEKKWALDSGDKDRVVMLHEFIYKKDGSRFKLQSVLDLSGEDEQRTAMARTVGMPLALAAELIANNKIQANGVLLPLIPEVYEPLLNKLKESGIVFREHIEKLN